MDHRLPQRPSLRIGGCDFAADPRLRSDQTPVIWLPRHNPRMTVLTGVQPDLFDGPHLSNARPTIVRGAPEGRYADLTALAPPHQALIAGEPSGTSPIAVVVPLDDMFEDRIETARRMWRAAVRGAKVQPAGFTPERARRLKLVLRALDAALLDIGYRDIARGLFGDRVPDDAAWRTNPLRATTIRLVQDGRALMRGGYLRLLRPDRRKR